MKNRDQLETKLQKKIENEVSNTKLVKSRFEELKEMDVDESFFAKYLHLRETVSAASDSVLYLLCSVYYPDDLNNYFLPKEIKQYNKISFKDPKIDFPLQLKMVEINEQQWIGKITARELMLWRNAQIINYNENAQRTMRKIIKRGQEFFQITLNNKAVDSVMELMSNNGFIPNTLTFNIPDDVPYDFNQDANILTIHLENNKLDILDGYHRYIAISKMLSKDENFDYNMEIRIVQFSESKAQQFIWQEDQKTRMAKSQSAAMNQYKLANQITQRLNDNGACDLYHHIEANGIINKGYFAQMVDKIYCTRIPKKDELKVQKKAVDILTNYLNKMIEEDETLLEKQWDRVYTYCAVFLSDKINQDITDKVNKLYNKVKEEQKYFFANQEISSPDLAKLTRLFKEI